MCTGHESTAPCPEEMARLLDRRGFLRASAVGAAAAAGSAGMVASPAVANDGDHLDRHDHVPKDHISIQLYTVRDILSADPAGTIATLAEIGYQRVETAGFAGLTPEAFKELLDENGIWASSHHIGIPQPWDRAAWRAQLRIARMFESTYIVHPFFGFGPVREKAVWRAFAMDLNRAGRMAKEAGLSLGYHNHQHEFLRLADDPRYTPFDILAMFTDPELVHFEVDLFWSWRGATDPVDLLAEHEGRIRQFHVKDMNLEGSFEDAGQGLIDFPRVFREAEGVDEFIVERDDAGTDGREPADALDTARVGFEYLRTVRF